MATQTVPESPASTDDTQTTPPKLVPGIELIGEYRGSGMSDPPFIARLPDGQIVQMKRLLYLVAEEVDGRQGYVTIAHRATERYGLRLSADMAEELVDRLRALGVAQASNGATLSLPKLDPLLALKLRAGIVPATVVQRIAAALRPIFFPPVVACVLTSLVVLDVWLFGYHGIAQSVRQALYEPAFILLMLGLVVLSAAFHEIGHGTACSYGGARPGVIGFGVYIVWPAFYTDVTDAYRLSRAGRLRTDLGGVYFNAIFVLVTAAAYFATGFEPLLLLIPLQHAEIVHQLLPFVRLDGYYVVSDLAGVPDMFSRIKPTLASFLPWREPHPSVTVLKRWVRVAVSVYVLTVVPLLLFFLVMLVISLPRILATSWDSGHREAHAISAAAGAGHSTALVVACIQLLVLALVPIGLLYTLGKLALKLAGGAWHVTERRPAARAGLLVAAATVAAFGAYAWLPSSMYRPIGPTEKGTLGDAVGRLEVFPRGHAAVEPGRSPSPVGAPRRSGATLPPGLEPRVRRHAQAERARRRPRSGRAPTAHGESAPGAAGTGRSAPTVGPRGTATGTGTTTSAPPTVTTTSPSPTVTTTSPPPTVTATSPRAPVTTQTPTASTPPTKIATPSAAVPTPVTTATLPSATVTAPSPTVTAPSATITAPTGTVTVPSTTVTTPAPPVPPLPLPSVTTPTVPAPPLPTPPLPTPPLHP